MGLIQNVKERRVTQIVVGYLVAGWLVMSVFDQFADRGVLPDVVYEVALTLFLFGIPVALILGWYHGEKGRQEATRFELFQLGVVVMAAIVSLTYVVRQDMQGRERQQLLSIENRLDLRSVAVTYFTADSEDMLPIAEGLTEALIERLAAVGDLNVISANGVAPFRGQNVSPDSIASVLGAGTIVQGSVARSGDQVRVTVRLVDGESGVELESIAPSWPADDLLTAREELPLEVARQFREILGQEIDLRVTRASTSSAPAWLLVQRAKKRMKDARQAQQAGDLEEATRLYGVADTELAEAVELDAEWVEPYLQRGWISYGLVQFTRDPDELNEHLMAARDFADEALRIQAGNGDAMELRGLSRYTRWFLGRRIRGILADQAEADALYAAARSDLVAATSQRGHPRALNALSSLYYQEGDLSSAVLAAKQAYEEDAYLESAPDVLNRLWLATFDLGEAGQADQWCKEGNDRFPSDYRFVQCQIWNMVMPGAEPDLDLAWGLLDEMGPLVPEPTREQWVKLTQIYIGGIAGRAQMMDSARAIMSSAREGVSPEVDAELLPREAAMWALLGESEEAISLLERYVVSNPGHFSSERGLHWFWNSLRGEERFERIRQMN